MSDWTFFIFSEDFANSIGDFSYGDGEFLLTSEWHKVNENIGNYNCLNERNILPVRQKEVIDGTE